MKKVIYSLAFLVFVILAAHVARPAGPATAPARQSAAPAQPKTPEVAPPAVSDACKADVQTGEALLAKDDDESYKNAAHVFKKAIETQYDCVPALIGYSQAITLGRGFDMSGEEYAEAYAYISRALVLDPQNARAYWVMADLMRHTNRPLIAARLADRSLTINPDDPWAHYVLASAVMSLKPEVAVIEFEKALKLKPDWQRASLNLAATYMSGGQFKKAERQLMTQLKADPTNVRAITNLGITHFRMGSLELADGDFKKALKYDPNFSMALKGLGDTALARKDYQTAVNSYKRYLDAFPADGQVWALLGQAQEGLKDYAAARISYGKTLNYNPKDAETQKRLDALPAASPQ